MAKRILLIEDRENTALHLWEYLIDKGLNVSLALTGGDAMKQLDAQDYDLVVTDVMLPDVDGLSVVRHGVTRYPNLKAIFVTAFREALNRPGLKAVPNFRILDKPCRPSEIFKAIQEAL